MCASARVAPRVPCPLEYDNVCTRAAAAAAVVAAAAPRFVCQTGQQTRSPYAVRGRPICMPTRVCVCVCRRRRVV